ncbi:MAG: TonB family protein [Acidobacteria bacterium]|nr:TonB family protein [Acidobacteriota bacterium]
MLGRSLFLALAIAIQAFAQSALAQGSPPQVGKGYPKIISGPEAHFPPEAANEVYGGLVSVSVEVNKKGKVTKAKAITPTASCSNLKDPLLVVIEKEAKVAAEQIVFEPFEVNGEVLQPIFDVTYVLSPALAERILTADELQRGAIKLPNPIYPPGARLSRISGSVTVRVIINEEGKVIAAGPVSGHSLLVPNALQAACKAVFTPTSSAGKPSHVSGTISYSFYP